MNFHGDSKRNNRFWLYPNKNIKNAEWDICDLAKYCDNYKYCHTFLETNITEYQCMGHTENKDILIAILAKDKGPCLPFYLQCIYNQDYDKKHLHLYIRTNDNNDNTRELLLEFIGKYGKEYGSVYYDDVSISPDLKDMAHRDWNSKRFSILGKIRQDSINYAEKYGFHYFVADCDNFVTPNTLLSMYNNKNYKVIGPMLPTQTGYSNFHYEVDDNGYFKNHDNYMKLLQKKLIGVHPVAVIHCTYFINNNTLKDIIYDDGTKRHEYVIFSDTLRKKNINQYLINTEFFGMLTWHTDEKVLKTNLQGYWKWALPAFKIDTFLTGYF
jgi:hypothetical protein